MTAAQPSGVNSATYTKANWRNSAACQGKDTEIFYPDTRPAAIEAAKAICRPCPVKNMCVADAFEQDDFNGVWGGLSEAERRAAQRKSNRLKPVASSEPPAQPSKSRPLSLASSPNQAAHSTPTAVVDETLSPDEVLDWYRELRHRLGPAAVRHLDNHYYAARHPNAPGRAQKLGWILAGLRKIDQPPAITA